MDVTEDCLLGQSLVFLTFLQQKGCENLDLKQELSDLERELKHGQDVNCNAVSFLCTDDSQSSSLSSGDDGELQTDGHSPHVHLQMCVMQDYPQVQARPPVPDLAVRDIARELVQIADQLENSVMARETDNLLRSLQHSNKQQWGRYLKEAVEHVRGALGQGSSLGDLPQERVVLALSLSLIKGVCERTPRFLRDLYHIWQQQHTR